MKALARLAIAATAAALATPLAAFPIANASGAGMAVIVTSPDDIIATYLGNSAAYSNDLYLVGRGALIFNNHTSPVGSTVNLGSFTPGTELIFRLHVNNTGNDFFSGPASRNPDNHEHAAVQGAFGSPDTTLVSFEDLFNGPFDYNDLSFSFTGTAAGPSGVPEPGTWAMMIGGFGFVCCMLRRRQRKARVTYSA